MFDGTDPGSTLQFAQFILGLQDQFFDMTAHPTHQRDVFCWRLDHNYLRDSQNPHLSRVMDWHSRVLEWLQGDDTW